MGRRGESSQSLSPVGRRREGDGKDNMVAGNGAYHHGEEDILDDGVFLHEYPLLEHVVVSVSRVMQRDPDPDPDSSAGSVAVMRVLEEEKEVMQSKATRIGTRRKSAFPATVTVPC